MNSLLKPSKWRIFLRVIPFSLLFCTVKYFFHSLGWEPWQFDSFTGALFATASFVLALVLNGTLSDYRSSEELPSLIVNALEEIQDSSRLFATINKEYNGNNLEKNLSELAQHIIDWLKVHKSIDSTYECLDQINLFLGDLANLGGASWINRPQAQLSRIRLFIGRIKTNRDTDFLDSAYALLWIFLGGSTLTLLLINGSTFSENLTVTAFIFTSFVYLLVLIRDLDNPFQYDGSSSVDVDLSVLQNFADRCKLT